MAYPIEVPPCTDFPEDAVLAYCQSSDRRTIYNYPGSTEVVRINDELIIKFGPGIEAWEFDNQEFAYQTLDPDIVRVPKPVHFFTVRQQGFRLGYIAMEWIEGFCPAGQQDIELVANAIKHLHTALAEACDGTGPVGGGICEQGFDEAVEFEDKADLENFLNDRLLDDGIPFSLQDQQLVLTHLDLKPDNIGRLPGGQVCILDWATAGFFPRWFEYAMVQACRSPDTVVNRFLDSLGLALEAAAPLTEFERGQMESLVQVVSNCIRWRFKKWCPRFYPPVELPPPGPFLPFPTGPIVVPAGYNPPMY